MGRVTLRVNYSRLLTPESAVRYAIFGVVSDLDHRPKAVGPLVYRRGKFMVGLLLRGYLKMCSFVHHAISSQNPWLLMENLLKTL